MRHALQSEKEISVYSRGNNPTVRLFEKKMASLEKTEDALAFSSGIAAITCSILNSVKAGDHIIAIEEVYGWTKVFFDQYLPGFGITTSYFNGNDLSELNSIIQANTKLIYLESPSSWFFSIQDLKSISEIARSRNIRTICDNSFASPLGQNPSQFGIDLIVHSASKYLGGHSDLVGGVVCGPSEILSGLFKEEYMNLGAIMSPNTAWLLIRGLRTLSIRLNHLEKTRETISAFLLQHPKIEGIIHPFEPDHPNHELAKRQMRLGGGLVSVFLKTNDPAQIEKFCNSLKQFTLAVSWGGHESLVFPAVSLMVKQEHSGLPINMIRLYVGLDDPRDLINDLDNALSLGFL